MNQRFQNQRKSIRLKDYDYSSSGAYSVTICAQLRRFNWFGAVARDGVVLNVAGEMVQRELQNLAERFTNLELDVFIVMPDHVHAIFVLSELPSEQQLIAPPKIPMQNPNPRRGELYVRPTTQRKQQIHNLNLELITAQSEKIPDLRIDLSNTQIVTGEHTVRPYIHPTGTSEHSLSRIVQLFKTFTTQEYIRGVRNLGWRPFEKRFWQRDYYEQIIQTERELEKTRDYILNNPARWLETRSAT